MTSAWLLWTLITKSLDHQKYVVVRIYCIFYSSALPSNNKGPCIFISGLFNDAASRLDYIASSDKMINKQWIQNDMEAVMV
jgi:hypothetical protein